MSIYVGLIGRLPEGRARNKLLRLGVLAPGIMASATVAMAATFLSDHYGGPVMLFALLLGIAFNFLSTEGVCKPGIEFTARTILRFGVGLLGARITIDEALVLGPTPLLLAVGGVILTISCGVLLAKLMRFNPHFGLLTGGAVGICGASAALAISSVLPRGENGVSERDTIFTVIAVTTLSTVAMVLYPILTHAIGFGEVESGIFLGATIHDVAQVVGAGYSISTQAGDAATLTKLLRVAMLVPVILAITLVVARGRDATGPRAFLPFFLIAFLALVAVNSLGLIPEAVGSATTSLSRWSLVAAIAGLGMKTALGQIASVGPKALLLVVAETMWIALIGLLVIWAIR